MTKLDYVKESLKMWEAILERWPNWWKVGYLREWGVQEDWPRNLCFICECLIGKDEDAECQGNCIIDWGSNEPYACEGCEDSPYVVFESTYDSGGDRDEQAVIDIIRLHKEAIERLSNAG